MCGLAYNLSAYAVSTNQSSAPFLIVQIHYQLINQTFEGTILLVRRLCSVLHSTAVVFPPTDGLVAQMGALKYVEELQKKKQSDVLRFLLRVRCWEVRKPTDSASGYTKSPPATLEMDSVAHDVPCYTLVELR